MKSTFVDVKLDDEKSNKWVLKYMDSAKTAIKTSNVELLKILLGPNYLSEDERHKQLLMDLDSKLQNVNEEYELFLGVENLLKDYELICHHEDILNNYQFLVFCEKNRALNLFQKIKIKNNGASLEKLTNFFNKKFEDLTGDEKKYTLYHKSHQEIKDFWVLLRNVNECIDKCSILDPNIVTYRKLIQPYLLKIEACKNENERLIQTYLNLQNKKLKISPYIFHFLNNKLDEFAKHNELKGRILLRCQFYLDFQKNRNRFVFTDQVKLHLKKLSMVKEEITRCRMEENVRYLQNKKKILDAYSKESTAYLVTEGIAELNLPCYDAVVPKEKEAAAARMLEEILSTGIADAKRSELKDSAGVTLGRYYSTIYNEIGFVPSPSIEKCLQVYRMMQPRLVSGLFSSRLSRRRGTTIIPDIELSIAPKSADAKF